MHTSSNGCKLSEVRENNWLNYIGFDKEIHPHFHKNISRNYFPHRMINS